MDRQIPNHGSSPKKRYKQRRSNVLLGQLSRDLQIQQWQCCVVSEESHLGQNVQALSNTQKKKHSFKKTITPFPSQKLGKFIANSTILAGGISARVCNPAGGRGFQKGSNFIS